jgi:hypothetical protein
LDEKIPIPKRREMEMKASQLGTQGKDEPYNRPFSEQELRNVIRNLPNTSPGPDDILPQFVKALPTSWLKVLLGIINDAWKMGEFPDVWKYGEAVMLPKPGKDPSKIENYRYITLLPVIGKVMERMIKKKARNCDGPKKKP